MLQLRPYVPADAPVILSWCRDEEAFYQWTAGILGAYPITEEQFRFVENLMAFKAVEDGDVVGFFTLRVPGNDPGELRFGFVTVDSSRRGRGLGRAMLKEGIRLARETLGAERLSLGVFENNPAAYRCYKAAGFQDVPGTEDYPILGQVWRCRELELRF